MLVAAFVGLVVLGLLLGEQPDEDAHKAHGVEPTLIQVPGYAYEDGAPRDAQEIDTRLNLTNTLALATYPKLTKGPYVSWSTHAVFPSQAGQVGVLVLVNLNPEFFVVNRSSTPDGAAVGLAQMLANSETTTHSTIAGEQVSVVTDANSTAYFAWERDNVAAVVLAMGPGTETAKAQNFVTAYLHEANK